jgi:copper(I)-binding protein
VIKNFMCSILFLLLSNNVYAGDEITVSHAWVREAPPTAHVSAGYLTIENNSDKPIVLTGITAENFSRAEIHDMRMEQGKMIMQQLETIVIDPHTRLELQPGGKHLMLMQPKKSLKAGEKTSVVLVFKGEKRIPVSMEVRQLR